MYRLRQMAATSATLDAPTKELIIDGVLRKRLPDALEAAVIRKLLHKVLLDGVSLEDATRGSVVAADTLKDHVEAVLVEMDRTAKEPRSLQLVPPKEEPAHSRNVSQRSLDADAPGPSSRIQDASYKEPKQEAAEEDGLSPVITEFLGFPEGPPAAASGNERTVYGFSYSFAAMQPTGLDMYRCVREKTCSALMFVHPDTGEIRFEGDHSHDVNATLKTEPTSDDQAAKPKRKRPAKGNKKKSNQQQSNNVKSEALATTVQADGEHVLRKKKREKLYECAECGKKFRHGHLRDHVLTHTGEKPFSCEECGKCFNRAESLRIHQRLHAEKKPFECDQCGRSYTSHKAMVQHQIVHTGILPPPPHECEVCGRRFTKTSDLKRHRMSHTEGRPFACEYCEATFKYSRDVARHQRKKHAVENDLQNCDTYTFLGNFTAEASSSNGA